MGAAPVMYGYCVIVLFKNGRINPHYVAPFLTRENAEDWIVKHGGHFRSAREFKIAKIVPA